jgi:hypothetical protein
MLTWIHEREGWVSNGYRIELLEPCRWVLLKNESTEVVPIPHAETYTLSRCKREAELFTYSVFRIWAFAP